jgi:ATP-dependent helicase HrpB
VNRRERQAQFVKASRKHDMMRLYYQSEFCGEIVSSLPICQVTDELLAALQANAQVILQAPPGAGKSTILPLTLLNQAWIKGKILMLEPRRLAARNVAGRLAEQLGQSPGQTVGYRIRSQSCVGKETRLEVITEGILTRKLQRDPLLEDVSLVILDEFHERSLQTDLALTLLLDVQQGLRDDLKILVMSATLDNRGLHELLPGAPHVSSEGRTFPIEREYIALPVRENFDDAVAGQALQLMRQQRGSLLVFLPGVGEIKRVNERLKLLVDDNVDLCPLYGALSFELQRKAILPSPSGRRKIVLATNIAETSLTIDGVHAVLDGSLERVALFDTKSGMSRLVSQRISKASMTQRAGRAGRLAPGICRHLMSKEQAERAAEQSEPEISHSDLTDLRLELLHWGCRDVNQLKWLTVPPTPALRYADRLLQQLNLIDDTGSLTESGRMAAELPCEPRIAAMLLYARKCGDDSLATAAMLAAIIEEPPRQGASDLHDWLLNPQPQWSKRAQQLQRLLSDKSGRVQPDEAGRLLVAGYPDRIARQRGQSGQYLLANGSGAALERDDALAVKEWLVAASVLQAEDRVGARILLAADIEPATIIADFPHLIRQTTAVEWQEPSGTLKTIQRRQIGKITLQQHYLTKPSNEQIQRALLDWIETEGVEKLNWDTQAEQLRTRIRLAKQWLPQSDWPDVDDETLSERLCDWLLPLLDNVRDIRGLRSLPLSEGLNQLLDWQQKQALEEGLPRLYRAPTGTAVAINYSLERPPVVAVRLQEMFGEQQSPTVAHGKMAVTLELLSPAGRPLQITADLAAFWRGSYQDVKKEMKGRYPKHVWPDDPANSKPTRKTKKYQD